MKPRQPSKAFLKCIALCTTFLFTISTILWTTPQPAAARVPGSGAYYLEEDISTFAHEVIPHEFGVVEEVYVNKAEENKGWPLVIHIQDAHSHYEVQQNIVSIIRSVISQYEARSGRPTEQLVVAVEGSAYRPINTAPLSWFKTAQETERVCNRLMQEGKISATEYLHAIDKSFIFYGLEDEELYEAGRSAYLTSLQSRTAGVPLIERVQEDLKEMRNKLYPHDFNILLSLHESCSFTADEGQTSHTVIDYLASLEGYAVKYGIDLKTYKNIYQLFELQRSIGKIDQKKVKTELAQVARELNLKSIQHHTLDSLTEEIEKSNIDLVRYPSLFKQIKFRKYYKRINYEELLFEIHELKDTLSENMLYSRTQKDLYRYERFLGLLVKLAQLKLSSDEEIVLQHFPTRTVKHLARFLDKHVPPAALTRDDYDTLTRIFKHKESFYRNTHARDKVLINNLQDLMGSFERPVFILVTGGFHTDNVHRLLKKEKCSFVSVIPHIPLRDMADVETKYHNALQRTMTPFAAELYQALKGAGVTEVTFTDTHAFMHGAQSSMELPNKLAIQALSSEDPVRAFAATVGTHVTLTREIMDTLRQEGKLDEIRRLAELVVGQVNELLDDVSNNTVKIVFDEETETFSIIADTTTVEVNVSDLIKAQRERLVAYNPVAAEKEAIDALSDGARDIKTLNPDVYRKSIRSIVLTLIEHTETDIIAHAGGVLMALGEATEAELMLIETMRYARNNIDRMSQGEIFANIHMGIARFPRRKKLFEYIYGAKKGEKNFIGQAQDVKLYGPVVTPPDKTKWGGFYAGSGFGLFSKKALMEEDETARAQAREADKTIVDIIGLNQGAGTRSVLQTVFSAMTKGQIPMFERFLIEQGMEQILEIMGSPEAGLPVDEWLFVVPADNIIMPTTELGQDFRNSGQSAFMFAPDKKVLGASYEQLAALSLLGMLFVNERRQVTQFVEKPAIPELIDMTVKNAAALLYPNLEKPLNALIQELLDIPEVRSAIEISDAETGTTALIDAIQRQEDGLPLLASLLLVAPLMFDEGVFTNVPTHMKTKDSELFQAVADLWSRAYATLDPLKTNEAVQAVIKRIEEKRGDYASANTFYFLLSRRVADTLERLLSGKTDFDVQDQVSKEEFIENFMQFNNENRERTEERWQERQELLATTSYWRRTKPIIGFDETGKPVYAAHKELFDWSNIILVPPTMTKAEWEAQYYKYRGDKFKDFEFYTMNDWHNLRYIVLEALKVGLSPQLAERKDEFMEYFKEYARTIPEDFVDYGEEAFIAYGERYFEILIQEEGLLKGMESLDIRNENMFNAIRETAIRALQRMGVSFIAGRFGDKWADAGNPTEWRDLMYETVRNENETLKMAWRMHFGLPADVDDEVESIIEDDVTYRGDHLIYKSAIMVPEGVKLSIGKNVVINNSHITIDAPPGTEVRIADGVVIAQSEITLSGKKLEQIARADGLMITFYFDGAENDGKIDLKADHVYGTLFWLETEDQPARQRTVTHHKDFNIKDNKGKLDPHSIEGANPAELLDQIDASGIMEKLTGAGFYTFAALEKKAVAEDKTVKNKLAELGISTVEYERLQQTHTFVKYFAGNGAGAWRLLDYEKAHARQEALARLITIEREGLTLDFDPTQFLNAEKLLSSEASIVDTSVKELATYAKYTRLRGLDDVYRKIVRTLIVALVQSPRDDAVALIGNVLIDLGETTQEELMLVQTIRQALVNFRLMQEGQIETNIVMGIPRLRGPLFKKVYGAKEGDQSFIGQADSFKILGPIVTPKGKVKWGGNYGGSGFGFFSKKARMQEDAATREKARAEGKMIIDVIGLNQGAGTRSMLQTVIFAMTKGQIPMFERFLIEQGMEQILEIIGSPESGLPIDEWLFVVPADNIILPTTELGNDFRTSGQSAFMFAPDKKVLGASYDELAALSLLGMLFVNERRQVTQFVEKPDIPRLIDMTIKNAAAILYPNAEKPMNELRHALLSIRAVDKAIDDSVAPDLRNAIRQFPELLLIAPLMFDKEVFDQVPAHAKTKDSIMFPRVEPLWQQAFDDLHHLRTNEEVQTIIDRIIEKRGDYANANTFYFLLSRKVIDTMERFLTEQPESMINDLVEDETIVTNFGNTMFTARAAAAAEGENTFVAQFGQDAWQEWQTWQQAKLADEAIKKELGKQALTQRKELLANTSYWRRPKPIIGFDQTGKPQYAKHFELFDWSNIILVSPTMTWQEWDQQYDAYGHNILSKDPDLQYYTKHDWHNLRYIVLEALKVGLRKPVDELKADFINRWNEKVDAAIQQYGAAYVDIVFEDGGLLKDVVKNADEIKEKLGITNENLFNAVREAAIGVLRGMGMSFIAGKFGDKWADAGNPTEWRDLMYETVKNESEILKLAWRMHFGLPADTSDEVESVIRGDVEYEGEHLIYKSVINVPGGVKLIVGKDVVINNSYITIYAPAGTEVRIPDGVVISQSQLTLEGEKLEQIAAAEGAMVNMFFDGGENDAEVALKADHVYGTLFWKETDDQPAAQRTVTHHKSNVYIKDNKTKLDPATIEGANPETVLTEISTANIVDKMIAANVLTRKDIENKANAEGKTFADKLDEIGITDDELKMLERSHTFQKYFAGNGAGAYRVLDYTKAQAMLDNLAARIDEERLVEEFNDDTGLPPGSGPSAAGAISSPHYSDIFKLLGKDKNVRIDRQAVNTWIQEMASIFNVSPADFLIGFDTFSPLELVANIGEQFKKMYDDKTEKYVLLSKEVAQSLEDSLEGKGALTQGEMQRFLATLGATAIAKVFVHARETEVFPLLEKAISLKKIAGEEPFTGAAESLRSDMLLQGLEPADLRLVAETFDPGVIRGGGIFFSTTDEQDQVLLGATEMVLPIALQFDKQAILALRGANNLFYDIEAPIMKINKEYAQNFELLLGSPAVTAIAQKLVTAITQHAIEHQVRTAA